jgi:hypothetical protein
MTSQVVNRRAEARYQSEETILIEAIASADHTDDSVIMCSSVDLSFGGLQLLTDEDFPLGTILRLCIDPKDDDPIFRVAEVRWRRPDPETGGYRTGFQIYDADEPGRVRWRAYIQHKFSVG